MAVKVTDVPAHIAPDGDAAMPTLAGNNGLTVMAIVPDVAGLPDAHDKLDVKTT